MDSLNMALNSPITASVRLSSGAASRKLPTTFSMCLCRILPTRFLQTSSLRTLPSGISISSVSLAYLLTSSSREPATEMALRVASLKASRFLPMKEKSFCVKQARIYPPVTGVSIAE